VLGLLRQAPPAAHLPPAPLAAVRDLLLDVLSHGNHIDWHVPSPS
jgi:hypothetical protein